MFRFHLPGTQAIFRIWPPASYGIRWPAGSIDDASTSYIGDSMKEFLMRSNTWPRNRLLLALPSADLTRLMPALERVSCEREQVLIDVDCPLDHVFFPDSGVVSAVAVYPDGRIIEMATIGREGCTGMQAAIGAESSFYRLLVQIPGGAAKMDSAAFMRAMSSVPSFRTLMYAYLQAFLEQVLVSVACNGAHSLKQRLARWLLMMRDRSDDDTLHDYPEPARRNAGCSKANGHKCCPRAGARRLDCSRPTASRYT
jgi:CRP-like cAMP-binding protein